RAHRWWSRVCRETEIIDEVGAPGTGPVAFATFGFDSDSVESVVVLPRLVFGRRGDRSWLTIVRPTQSPAVEPGEVLARLGSDQPRAPRQVSWPDDADRVRAWRQGVAEAIRRITAGELDKVVLARDVFARASEPIDPVALLTRLTAEYPDCWAFSVAGLVGATPEMLVRREGDVVSSRVLAGTVRSGWDSGEAGRLAAELLGSDKNLAEHELAVASVAASLAAHCTDLSVPEEPRILKLANVQHLATDVFGSLATETPVLALAASLHPTAAVCGTPTERAHSLIRELEPMDRGRYAGPVGWMDSHGDGEFGIALRCGQIDPQDPCRIRLFAGCGIVAGSQPESEVVESEVKLQPMRMALDSQLSHPVNRRAARAT
ncbi:MAG: isochorismate synthase, partial [Candidatus Nanopelagicales bacterium]|nr:isochorismate synthase [Candidatus Nanopelagicales bacterium]